MLSYCHSIVKHKYEIPIELEIPGDFFKDTLRGLKSYPMNMHVLIKSCLIYLTKILKTPPNPILYAYSSNSDTHP